VTVRSTTGLDRGRAKAHLSQRRDADIERTPVAGSNQRPSQPSPSEIRTIARRLQHASDTMGVHIPIAFAERMATEGLSRSDEVGMVKTSDTVIFFAESANRAGVTVLGWADQHTRLDRFASLELVPNPPATASLDAGPADTGPLDDMGPEL
jgi:hypothetical protein